jgi:tetratricopeptide (TPR) repeat protein
MPRVVVRGFIASCLPISVVLRDSAGSFREAGKWGLAADMGDAQAAYRVGHACLACRDYYRAEWYLRRAAEAGILEAVYDLINILTRRRRRRAEARPWYTRAGDLAHAQELPVLQVARYYMSGGSYDDAARVLRPAAEDGDPLAAAYLGYVIDLAAYLAAYPGGTDFRARMDFRGNRPDADIPDEALPWYKAALEHGYESAASQPGAWEETGPVPENARDHQRAIRARLALAPRGIGRLAWRAGLDREAEKYLRIAHKQYHLGECDLDLIEFLASTGRRAQAQHYLPDIEELDEDLIQAVAAALSRAGWDEAADKYRRRAEWLHWYHMQ